MTDAAIANGLYMKTLGRKEAVAVLAEIVLEREFADNEFQEAWDTAEVLRPYYPNNLAVLQAPADAARGLLQEEFLTRYKAKSDIPPDRLARFDDLQVAVSNALNQAYALGWRQTDSDEASVSIPSNAR